jgi:hypothetical protein
MAEVLRLLMQDNAASTTVVAGVGSNATLVDAGNSEDIVATGPGGTLTGGLQLDNTNDLISLATLFDVVTSPYTIAFWYRQTSTAGDHVILFENLQSSAPLMLSGGVFTLINYDAQTTQFTVADNDTNWHFAMFVVEADGDVLFYEDDLAAQTNAAGMTGEFLAETISSSNGCNMAFAGFRFYDTAEPEATRDTLLDEGGGDPEPPFTPTFPYPYASTDSDDHQLFTITLAGATDLTTLAYVDGTIGDYDWSGMSLHFERTPDATVNLPTCTLISATHAVCANHSGYLATPIAAGDKYHFRTPAGALATGTVAAKTQIGSGDAALIRFTGNPSAALARYPIFLNQEVMIGRTFWAPEHNATANRLRGNIVEAATFYHVPHDDDDWPASVLSSGRPCMIPLVDGSMAIMGTHHQSDSFPRLDYLLSLINAELAGYGEAATTFSAGASGPAHSPSYSPQFSPTYSPTEGFR